jgi:hypothetical protein
LKPKVKTSFQNTFLTSPTGHLTFLIKLKKLISKFLNLLVDSTYSKRVILKYEDQQGEPVTQHSKQTLTAFHCPSKGLLNKNAVSHSEISISLFQNIAELSHMKC